MLRAVRARGLLGRAGRAAIIGAGALLLWASCGGHGATATTPGTISLARRPATDARLQIAAPAPGAVTGRSVLLRFELSRARLVPPAQVGGAIRADRGHVHVLVDGQLVGMPYALADRLPPLRPGVHTVEAEFVASDHLPFSNRVVAAVTFDVK